MIRLFSPLRFFAAALFAAALIFGLADPPRSEAVGIAAHSDVGAMQNFVSKYGLNFTNLNDSDGSIWARYNVPWQPAWVFYRADGTSTFVNNPTSAMPQQELAGRVAALR